jgi:alpha-L-fucosidase
MSRESSDQHEHNVEEYGELDGFGYKEFVPELTAERYRSDEGAELNDCEQCGSKTGSRVCRKCRLIESINAV